MTKNTSKSCSASFPQGLSFEVKQMPGLDEGKGIMMPIFSYGIFG